MVDIDAEVVAVQAPPPEMHQGAFDDPAPSWAETPAATSIAPRSAST
jgi:hypothetical protein